jgi:predicted MPP superfamily phosphohydrolase
MNRRTFIRLAAGAALGGTAFGVGGLRGAASLEFTRGRIPGAGTAKLRLAHLSDLHLRSLTGQHRRIADGITAEAPELMLFTGDSVDQRDALPLLDAFLAMLPARTPKYAILGNWEHWSGVDLHGLAETYARHGGRLLVNETAVHVTQAGASLAITGVDDLEGTPDLGRALGGITPSPNHLLLAHSPAYRDGLRDPAPSPLPGAPAGSPLDLAAFRFRAMLSGHTHGGQVAIAGWAPLRPPGSGRYVRGWYRDGDGPPCTCPAASARWRCFRCASVRCRRWRSSRCPSPSRARRQGRRASTNGKRRATDARVPLFVTGPAVCVRGDPEGRGSFRAPHKRVGRRAPAMRRGPGERAKPQGTAAIAA